MKYQKGRQCLGPIGVVVSVHEHSSSRVYSDDLAVFAVYLLVLPPFFHVVSGFIEPHIWGALWILKEVPRPSTLEILLEGLSSKVLPQYFHEGRILMLIVT